MRASSEQRIAELGHPGSRRQRATTGIEIAIKEIASGDSAIHTDCQVENAGASALR